MKRSAVRLGMMVIALAAVWAQAPAPGAAAAPEWTLPQHRVTVTYWDSVDGPRNELMANPVIPAYMRLHSQIAKDFTIKYLNNADPQQALDQAANEYAAAYK